MIAAFVTRFEQLAWFACPRAAPNALFSHHHARAHDLLGHELLRGQAEERRRLVALQRPLQHPNRELVEALMCRVAKAQVGLDLLEVAGASEVRLGP